MKVQRALMVLLAWAATTAPIAHVLELPNKLELNGPTWLMVQQRLYQGWGPIFGPIEILALILSLWMSLRFRSERQGWRTMFVASIAYLAMIVDFFLMNAPVNDAVNRWTAAGLPADWPRYRLQWETGHAGAAILSLIALVAVARSLAASCQTMG